MQQIRSFLADLELIPYLFWRHILGSWKILIWLGLFVFIVFILQWLFNIEQLWHILNDSSLAIIDKMIFLQNGFFNIFRYANDIVPISIILISFMQATALTFYWVMRYSKNNAIKSQLTPMTVGLIGAGCVACGGSVLTPLLSVVASNLSLTQAQRLSDIILLIAVILSYRALSKVSFVYASKVAKIYEHHR